MNTRLDPGDPENPLQVDYLFASKSLTQRAASCLGRDAGHIRPIAKAKCTRPTVIVRGSHRWDVLHDA